MLVPNHEQALQQIVALKKEVSELRAKLASQEEDYHKSEGEMHAEVTDVTVWCSSNLWSSALAFPLDFILKSDVLLARHVFCQEGLRDKGSRGHSGLRVVPGYFLRNSKASELLKRAKMTTRVSPSSRVAIFTRAGVIRLLYYSWVHLNISVAGEGVGKERKREVFPLPPLLFVPVTQAVTEKNDGLLVVHPSHVVCRVSPCYHLPPLFFPRLCCMTKIIIFAYLKEFKYDPANWRGWK